MHIPSLGIMRLVQRITGAYMTRCEYSLLFILLAA